VSSLLSQINIKQLRDKIENLKTEIEEKSADATAHTEQKQESRSELQELITKCEELYIEYDSARIQVSDLKLLFMSVINNTLSCLNLGS
jgi:archaellum component FlaC